MLKVRSNLARYFILSSIPEKKLGRPLFQFLIYTNDINLAIDEEHLLTFRICFM